MKVIRAVLFDMIGTTVLEKDPYFITACFEKAFKQHDVHVTGDQISRIRGMDKKQAIALMLNKRGQPSDAASEIFETFQQKVLEGISNFEEHPELGYVVDQLKIRGIKIGVASGLPNEIFQILTNNFGWLKYGFDYENVYANFNQGRPDPALILDMCKKLSIHASSVLKVGDTIADVEEGKRAGTRTAAVLAGTQSQEMLLATGPDYVLHSLRDVLHILTNRPFNRA